MAEYVVDEKMKELFSNKEFTEKFLALKTPEEAQAALNKEGFTFTAEEAGEIQEYVKDLLENVKKEMKENNGEVPDDLMAAVAGGAANVKDVVKYGKKGMKVGKAIGTIAGGPGKTVGAVIGAGVGAVIGFILPKD